VVSSTNGSGLQEVDEGEVLEVAQEELPKKVTLSKTKKRISILEGRFDNE